MPFGFSANDFIVYPAHGVGQILTIEEQTVAGASLEFFVIYFAKSKLTLRVPTCKAYDPEHPSRRLPRRLVQSGIPSAFLAISGGPLRPSPQWGMQ